MSGLVTYFRSFLTPPPSTSSSHHRRSSSRHDDTTNASDQEEIVESSENAPEEEEEDAYTKSLADSIIPPPPAMESPTPHHQGYTHNNNNNHNNNGRNNSVAGAGVAGGGGGGSIAESTKTGNSFTTALTSATSVTTAVLANASIKTEHENGEDTTHYDCGNVMDSINAESHTTHTNTNNNNNNEEEEREEIIMTVKMAMAKRRHQESKELEQFMTQRIISNPEDEEEVEECKMMRNFSFEDYQDDEEYYEEDDDEEDEEEYYEEFETLSRNAISTIVEEEETQEQNQSVNPSDLLETQPPAISPTNRREEEDDDGDGASSSSSQMMEDGLETQPFTTTTMTTPQKSTISTSLSPLSPALLPPASQSDSSPPQQRQQQKSVMKRKRQKQQQPKTRKRRRRYPKVIHLDETTKQTTTIEHMNLHTKNLTLDLAKIRLIWSFRRGRHKLSKWEQEKEVCVWKKIDISNNENQSHVVDDDDEVEEEEDIHSYRFDENVPSARNDFGPIFIGYKHVLSMEIMTLDDEEDLPKGLLSIPNNNIDGDGDDVTMTTEEKEQRKEQSRFLHESASAAFATNAGGASPNKSTFGINATTTTNNNTMKPLKRRKRIRLFLYNSYATKMHSFLTNHLEDKIPHHNIRDKSMKNKSLRDLFVISLRNIPAQCIVPLVELPKEEETTSSGLLMEDYGRLSRYCICIGGDSKLKRKNTDGTPSSNDDDENAPLSFDSDDLEIRILKLVEDNKKGKDGKYVTMKKNFSGDEKEFVIRRSMKSASLVDSSGMARRFCQFYPSMMMMMRQEEVEDTSLTTTQNRTDRQGESEEPMEETTLTTPNRVDTTTTTTTTPTTGKRKRQPIVWYRRLNRVVTMANSKQTQGNGKTRRDEQYVNVFGAVLSIRPPSLAKTGQWMMQITLIDESLSSQMDRQQTTNNSNTEISSSGGSPTKFVHVTLQIFNRFKNFPDVLCAGDILRAHRVKPDVWNGDIKLISRHNSSFEVYRPKASLYKRYLEDQQSLNRTTSSNILDDWEMGHKLETTHTDIQRVAELWTWAQMRLASSPTTNLEFGSSIAEVQEENHKDARRSDISIMIVGIIPINKQSSKGGYPRGFLRAWDGTGKSVSDLRPDNRKQIQEPCTVALSTIASLSRSMNEIDSQTAQRYDPPKKLCGRVINIAVWEDTYWELIEQAHRFVKIGQFIRLRNIRMCFSSLPVGSEAVKEVIGLSIDKQVSFTSIPNYTYEIKRILHEHNTRIRSEHLYNPNSACLPLRLKKTFGERLPRFFRQDDFSDLTLSTIQQCMTGKAPDSFSIRFYIVPPFPYNDIKDFRVADTNGGSNHTFQFSMWVRDETAEMEVVVSNDASEQLLGIPASMHTDNFSEEKISNLTNFVYEGIVQSLVVDGQKFFVLDSVDFQMEDDSGKTAAM